MARVKLVNGVLVDLTAEEEAARDAEQSVHTEALAARRAERAAFGYRLQRAEAYRAAWRPANTHEETIGDVIDTILDVIALNPALALPQEMVDILAELPRSRLISRSRKAGDVTSATTAWAWAQRADRIGCQACDFWDS